MDYLTIPQVAKMLGVSRVTIYRKVKSGQIPARKIGRTYAVEDSQIKKILRRKLTSKDKQQIDKVVRKIVKQYGETLVMLGKE